MIVALSPTTDKISALPVEHTERVFAVCSLITSEKDMKMCHLIGKRLLPSAERRIKTRKLTGDNPLNRISMKNYHEEEIPIEEDFNPWDEKERAV